MNKLVLDRPPAIGETRRFPAGAEAPKWLVDLEPFHPSATPAPIYFTGVTDVIDVGDRYIVLPIYAGVSNLGALNTAAQGCNVFAGSKEVRMVTAAMILSPDPMQQPAPAVTRPGAFTEFPPAPDSYSMKVWPGPPAPAASKPRKKVFDLRSIGSDVGNTVVASAVVLAAVISIFCMITAVVAWRHGLVG